MNILHNRLISLVVQARALAAEIQIPMHFIAAMGQNVIILQIKRVGVP